MPKRPAIAAFRTGGQVGTGNSSPHARACENSGLCRGKKPLPCIFEVLLEIAATPRRTAVRRLEFMTRGTNLVLAQYPAERSVGDRLAPFPEGSPRAALYGCQLGN